MNQINWYNDGGTQIFDMRETDTALYAYGFSGGPFFQTGPVNSSWTYTDHNGLQTVTIVAITSVTVPAGTFSNVYEIHTVNSPPNTNGHDEYMYWKPGVGLIKDVDYSNPATPTLTMELTGFNLGAKTAPLELLLLTN